MMLQTTIHSEPQYRRLNHVERSLHKEEVEATKGFPLIGKDTYSEPFNRSSESIKRHRSDHYLIYICQRGYFTQEYEKINGRNSHQHKNGAKSSTNELEWN